MGGSWGRIVGVVSGLNVATGSSCVEFDVATDVGLAVEFDVGPGVGLAVELADTKDVGRGLASLFVGLGSCGTLDFDLPNPKSLAKNPRFLTFCYVNNMLRATVTVREIFTGGGWIGLLFNNDEGGGVRSGRKRALVFSTEDEAIDG